MCWTVAIPITLLVIVRRGDHGPGHLAIPLVLLWAVVIFELRTLLFPFGSSLRLSPAAFSFGTALGRRSHSWAGVRGFRVRPRRVLLFWSKEVVAFSFSGDGAPPMHADDPSWRHFEHEIPNMYELSPAALAELLNEFLHRVTDAAAPSGNRLTDLVNEYNGHI
jgi:hypothetical protein